MNRNNTIKKALLNKGMSLKDNKEVIYKTGYIVGKGNINIIDTNLLKGTDNQIQAILQIVDNQNITEYGIGVDNNLIYIDLIEYVESLEVAKIKAKKLKELAIGDNKNNKEIRITK